MHARLLQLCPTLCNPMDCSPPDSSDHGILQTKNTGEGCHAVLQGIFPTNPGIKPESLMSLALAGGFFTTSAPILVSVHLYAIKNYQEPKNFCLFRTHPSIFWVSQVALLMIGNLSLKNLGKFSL